MPPRPVKTEPLTKAQQKLVEDNTGIAYKFASEFCKRHPKLDIGDVTGPALEGLCLAAQRYRPDYGARFVTYAATYIRGYVFNQAKDKFDIIRTPRWRGTKLKQVRQKTGHAEDEAPFEEWVSGLPAAARDETNTSDIEHLDVVELMRALEACVTPLQFASIRERVSGLEFGDIAKKFGMTRQAVNNAYHRGIVKARRSLRRGE